MWQRKMIAAARKAFKGARLSIVKVCSRSDFEVAGSGAGWHRVRDRLRHAGWRWPKEQIPHIGFPDYPDVSAGVTGAH
jgi:hypothetical protein